MLRINKNFVFFLSFIAPGLITLILWKTAGRYNEPRVDSLFFVKIFVASLISFIAIALAMRKGKNWKETSTFIFITAILTAISITSLISLVNQYFIERDIVVNNYTMLKKPIRNSDGTASIIFYDSHSLLPTMVNIEKSECVDQVFNLDQNFQLVEYSSKWNLKFRPDPYKCSFFQNIQR